MNFHPILDFLFGWGIKPSTIDIHLKSIIESTIDFNQPIVTIIFLTSKIEMEVDNV
jgi:hypothetical protein